LDSEKKVKNEVLDFLKDLVIIVIVVKAITIFLVSVFIINGQSMYASYYDKEYILVDRFSALEYKNYKKQDVKRWDVIVFKPWVDVNKKYFIKRVIWKEWDSIKIKDGNVFRKNAWEKEFVRLDEKYLNKENYWNTKVDNKKDEIIYNVPKWQYFVMWDNRNHSSDSRSCFTYSCKTTDRKSFITKKSIVGKMLVDFWYFNYRNFSFTHPVLKDENWKYISTKPKWLNSKSTFSY